MAIIKYYVEMKGVQDASGWQWEETFDPLEEGKILSHEQALKKIEKQGLVLVHKNEHGEIWDEPSEPFFQKYQFIYSRNKLRV